MSSPQILFCNCTYAQVVPKEVKDSVLKHLCDSGVPFEAVADLCEMSARRDPALRQFSAQGGLKIAACFPRAVQWLFQGAQAPLSMENTEVLNMRVLSAEQTCQRLNAPDLIPNLDSAKTNVTDSTPATSP